MLRAVILLLLVLGIPCNAGDSEWRQVDIPPKKGDISKNIHVVFDKSGSMGVSELAKAYKEIEMLIMQNTDEFNLSVTAFGADHLRMSVVDKDCKLGKNWMAMPSAVHYKRIMEWLTYANVNNGGSQIVTSLKEIIKENKKDLTVIVISDTNLSSLEQTFKIIREARKKETHHPFKLGFVNVTHSASSLIYKRIKEHKCWYVSTPKPKPIPKNLELDLDDDDFWND